MPVKLRLILADKVVIKAVCGPNSSTRHVVHVWALAKNGKVKREFKTDIFKQDQAP